MAKPDELSPSLVDLARTAAVALSCDALLITRVGARREMSIVVPDGLSPLKAETLARIAAQCSADFARCGPMPARQVSLRGTSTAGSATLDPKGGLVVPVCQDGVLVGVLAALRDGGDFRPEERSLADVFARHFGIALAPRAPDASRYLNGLLEALDEINRRAASVTRIDELSSMLDPALASVFGPVRSGLALWDESQGVLEMVSSTFPVDIWETNLADLRSSTVRVFLTGTSWVTDHALTDPGVLKDQPGRFQVERLIQIQLNAAGRRIGVLTIAMEDHPSIELLETIERLAPHLATVVEFARTAARLRRRGDLTAAVSTIAVAIASVTEQSRDRELLHGIRHLKRTLGACAVAIERDGTGDIVEADRDAADHVASILANFRESGPNSIERSVAIDPTRKSWLFFAPIELSGEHIGTLLALKHNHRFHHDEQASLRRVANLFALQASSDRLWRQRIQLTKVRERERLADDLHDDLVQLLYGVQLNLDLAMETPGDSVVDERLLRSRDLAASADKVLRQMINDRSDPVTPALENGIGEIVRNMRLEHGLEVEYSFSREPRGVPDELTHLLLRVGRECLTNVAKHAKSRRAQLRVLVSPDEIEMTISDDGAGVDPGPEGVEGYGFASLRRSLARHGGHLLVTSSDHGTNVSARVELPKGRPD